MSIVPVTLGKILLLTVVIPVTASVVDAAIAPLKVVAPVTENAPGIDTAPVVPVMPIAFVSTPPLFTYRSKFLLLVPFLTLTSP